MEHQKLINHIFYHLLNGYFGLRKIKTQYLTLIGIVLCLKRIYGQYIIEKIAGAKGMNHRRIEAGHFSQENQPELIAETILSID